MIKLPIKKFYILTIASIGLFIGFWLGYFVFAQVHIKVICKPSGKTLLDVTRSLRYDFVLTTGVEGCEAIDLAISRPNLPDITLGIMSPPPQPTPTPPTTTPTPEKGELPTPPQFEKTQETTTTNKSSISEQLEPETYTKVPYLEIFDICSINTGCVDEKVPYYMILDKNDTHLEVSFYEGIGFNDVLKLLDSTSFANLFIQDLATLPEETETVEIYGALGKYFSIGNYNIQSVLEGRAKGVQPTKQIMIATLNVDKNIEETSEWSQVKFYLKSSENLYYVGDIWFFVK